MKASLVPSLFLFLATATDARPTDWNEHNSSAFIRWAKGTYVGFQSALSLMGYYDYGDQDNDQQHRFEPTTIQIAIVGSGRTGSTSLALALEKFGYTVFHDDEHVEHTELFDKWYEGEIDADELNRELGRRGYNVTNKSAGEVDFIKNNPQIKVILTVRDNAEVWVDSWLRTASFYDILTSRPFIWFKTTQNLVESFYEEFLEEPTNGVPEKYMDKEHLKAVYEERNANFIKEIPSERLLVFNVKQGWEPLCTFLNLPVPENLPFPHVHDRIKLEAEHSFLYLVTWIWPLPIILTTLFLGRLVQKIVGQLGAQSVQKS